MVTQPVTMYDSLDVTAIPAGATFVAGYVDGEDRTWQALVRRFPKAHKESITRSPQFRADWLDVESGAAQPSDVPAWTVWMRSLGLIAAVPLDRAQRQAARVAPLPQGVQAEHGAALCVEVVLQCHAEHRIG